MSLNILLVGPVLPPIHGQSLAFTRFFESIDSSSKLIIDTNMEELSGFAKLFGTLKTLYLILYTLLFKKVDIVYFTCSRSLMGSVKDILLINLASFKNIKIINHLHGSDFYDFVHGSSPLYKKILLKSYEKVETSIVLLNSMKQQFKDFPVMNIEVVSNFYDKELEVELIKKDNTVVNIVYLSNIIKSKGVLELVDAFNELSSLHDNIYLNIAGGFMSDEYLSSKEIKQRFLEKISQNSKIKYLGKVFGGEKVKLLQSSDIFVLPSYYKSEAFPISIIEAMVCSNAIVTTNYKYLPEVVNAENGLLVEVKSVESLRNAIVRLLHNPDILKAMQIHNKKEAQKKYSLNQYIDTLHGILNI